MLLDPDVIVPADISALRAFVIAGGRLIAGGREPGAWLSELIAESPDWIASGATTSTPLVPLAETDGVALIESDGAGAWSNPNGGALPAIGRPVAHAPSATLGAGRIELLADASPLQNHLLADADNAALGLALAGTADPSPSRRRCTATAPIGTRRAADPLEVDADRADAGGAARGRRQDPPTRARQPPAPPAFPPRRAHVDALASALARTGAPASRGEDRCTAMRGCCVRAPGCSRTPTRRPTARAPPRGSG